MCRIFEGEKAAWSTVAEESGPENANGEMTATRGRECELACSARSCRMHCRLRRKEVATWMSRR